MKQQIYTFLLAPDWKLINELSHIDKFGGSWSSIEKREGQSLKQLKAIATVRSVGASTRIEGSKMTDDEVEVLIKKLEGSIPEERDQQEVAGYYETLDLITESYRDIEITENNLQHLHNVLMKYSRKDEWHKGKYKQHSNVVEATNPNGSKHVVFQTTEPGLATEDAMRKLVEWYEVDAEAHPIIRSALFVYDFLSIHPFQDGNGRLSRLLATLLLLKHGYSWIQYVSFEHEIENRKGEYYKLLMQCQKQRPGEDVYPWAIFFLDCLNNIQSQLMKKLEMKGGIAQLSPREKKIYVFIESHPGSKSGNIAGKLDVPLPTVKRILSDMVMKKFLIKHGTGAGTNYTIEKMPVVKTDLIFRLTNNERNKELTFLNTNSFIEIKKIVLIPLFKWTIPDEWSAKLINQGLYLQVECISSKGGKIQQSYSISSYNSPYFRNPEFTLGNPITIPAGLWSNVPHANEYPVKASIALHGSVSKFDFDVMVVYNASVD